MNIHLDYVIDKYVGSLIILIKVSYNHTKCKEKYNPNIFIKLQIISTKTKSTFLSSPLSIHKDIRITYMKSSEHKILLASLNAVMEMCLL